MCVAFSVRSAWNCRNGAGGVGVMIILGGESEGRLILRGSKSLTSILEWPL